MKSPIIALILLPLSLSSQNLIFNGGFEKQSPPTAGVWQARPKPCKFSSASDVVNTSANGWTTFAMQTPDLLEWDTVNNCLKLPQPHKGTRMMGLIMYHPFQDGQFAFDYHELIQGTFTRPLEKGKTYRLSFWVYTNDTLGADHLNAVYGRTSHIRPTLCGNFGCHFSDAPINPNEDFMTSQLDFPVKPQINLPQIIETKGKWRKISMAFTPDKNGYRYFLFGNFFSDAVTAIDMPDEERMKLDEQNQSLEFWKKTKRIGYYLFDDFSLVLDDNAALEQALLVDKKYDMPEALLFDFGKSELRPGAEKTLIQLSEVLKKYPELRFEIGGHTDSVGEENANQVLSEQRAQTVYNALILHEVPASQMRWKGFGEAQPVAPNDTETDRQKNRRVVCKVLD